VASKPIQGVVPGDLVRHVGSTRPHRTVEGKNTGPLLVRLYFREGGHMEAAVDTEVEYVAGESAGS
jgi:hypothetical protein